MMTNSLKAIKRLGIKLPITEDARNISVQFSQTQLDATKANQVQLNTLAVLIAYDYCQIMGIPADLEQSDSWNSLTRTLSDVADLTLPGIGQLECRPVRPDAEQCFVPSEVWDLRIGYIIVEISSNLQMGKLLGFLPNVNEETISLTQLKPLEDFLEHLYVLEQSATINLSTVSVNNEPRVLTTTVHLWQWLDGIFDTGWQTVETLLSEERMTLEFGFRNPDLETLNESESTNLESIEAKVQRAKLIDLVVQLGSQPVVMVAELQIESPDKTLIALQLHPAEEAPYLPPGIELSVLETSGEVFMEAQARQADNCIQLQFAGKPGEQFQVRISIENTQYIEEFVI